MGRRLKRVIRDTGFCGMRRRSLNGAATFDDVEKTLCDRLAAFITSAMYVLMVEKRAGKRTHSPYTAGNDV